MSDFDEIITNTASPKEAEPQDKPFDPVAWAAEKKDQRDGVYTLLDIATVKAVSSPEQLRTFLDVTSRLSRYSTSNALLICEQNPDATRLGDFNYWKDRGSNVSRGQKGITILEPGNEFPREDGTVGVYYEPKKVFDVTQTHGRVKAPQPAQYLDRALISALMEAGGKEVLAVEPVDGASKALFDPQSNVITIEKGLGINEGFSSLAREVAQVEISETAANYSHAGYAFHAEAAAYIITKRAGLSTDNIDLKIPEGLAAKEPKEIRAELNRVHEAANEVFGRMEPSLESERNTHQKPSHSREAR
jgi:hypothetical protein